MATDFSLYTVTGGRERYYAAVDWETGRTWTAPTKDGAARQAREAGLRTCSEHVISKEELLRSLGVGPDRPMRITADSSEAPAKPPKAKRPSQSAAWFVPGEGAIEPATSVPQRSAELPGSRRGCGSRNARGTKPSKGGKGKSPFSATKPIAAPSSGASADDILTGDPTKSADVPPVPFADGPQQS